MSTPRRENEHLQEPWSTELDHAQLTASETFKLGRVPSGRKVRIDRAYYVNNTGLAADATNAMKLELKNDTTLVASVFNTDSDDDPAGAAIVAAAIVDAVLSATDADLVLDAGDVLLAVFTEDGAATLPPGRLRVEGRYVQ